MAIRFWLSASRGGKRAPANEPAPTLRGWISRLSFPSAGSSAFREASAPRDYEDERYLAKKRMIDSFALALNAREDNLELISHAARVAVVAGYLADTLEVDEGEQYLLRTAAYLHELGLLTLNGDLVDGPAPAPAAVVAHLRRQALASAEMAKAAFHPRIVALIANQYSDYSELQLSGMGRRDQLLAGIFRVADVFATVTWPRANEAALTWPGRTSLLNEGAGTRFHPLAVRAALSLA